MIQDDLELVSTQDLIEELMRRTTFQGIVVHSQEEARGQDWSGERVFTVRFNANLEHEAAGRLLGIVSEYMDRNWA